MTLNGDNVEVNVGRAGAIAHIGSNIFISAINAVIQKRKYDNSRAADGG